MSLGGFLKRSGEWIELPYYSHIPWAREECERLGIDGGISPVDVLAKKGYVQISNGQAFLLDREINFIKLTSRQLDFLLIHAGELSGSSRLALVAAYDIKLPDTPKSYIPTPDEIVEPPACGIS